MSDGAEGVTMGASETYTCYNDGRHDFQVTTNPDDAGTQWTAECTANEFPGQRATGSGGSVEEACLAARDAFEAKRAAFRAVLEKRELEQRLETDNKFRIAATRDTAPCHHPFHALEPHMYHVDNGSVRHDPMTAAQLEPGWHANVRCTLCGHEGQYVQCGPRVSTERLPDRAPGLGVEAAP